MKNNLIFHLAFVCVLGCTTHSTINKHDSNLDYIAIIEGVPFNSNKNDIVKNFGETKDSGLNEKEGFFALGYPDSKMLRRYTFVFNKKTEKLISKSVDIGDGDPESSVDFWKSKYPQGKFKTESKTISHGHFWTTDEWISVNKNLTLSVSKNKIIQASWASNN